tara:strand:- start:721 stop:1734 length:1014 start_codon:yes stop_codon:yes gene_type:complete
MATPFSLEWLASKVNLAGKKARQTYFNKLADEATEHLSDLLDSMQKHAKKATGIFQGTSGKLGKTALNILLGAIPGAGPALSLALNAADLAKSQKDYASRIKSMSGDFNIPSKYKGTFMEDYLIGGIEAGRSDLKSFLKGSKHTDLLTGLISLMPQALSVGKSLGPLQKLDATKAKDITSDILSSGAETKAMTSDILGAGTKTKAMTSDILTGVPRVDAGKTIEDVIKSAASDYSDYDITDIVGKISDSDITDIVGLGTSPTNLGKLLSAIGESGVPYTGLNIKAFADPLAQSGGPLLKSLTTPGTYTPVLQNLLMDYLKQQREEPIMTRLQAPKVY